MPRLAPLVRLLTGCLLGLGAPALSAKPWALETHSDELKELAGDLQKERPEIRTEVDLEAVMSQIGESQSLSQLEAADEGDRILIRAELAHTIRLIKVKTLTRAIRYEVETKLGKYVGQTDSPELQQQMKDEILGDLKLKGFYLARVAVGLESRGSGVAYNVIVDEGYLCKVSKVESTFRLPNAVSNPFEAGMDCNINEIKMHLGELESDLIEAGYNLQRIQTPQLIFDAQSNTAVLKLEGNLGKKILYKVESPIKNPGVISAVFGDSLNSLDTSITDPDAMASELARKYRTQGYDDVEISRPRVQNPDAETTEYTFTVTPGPEYRIIDVQFEGLDSLTEDQAEEAINMKSLVGNTPVFSQDLVMTARESLRTLYLEQGFWDANIFDPRVVKNPATGEVRLVFVIREGKRRVFDRMILIGNQTISSDEIVELFDLDTGDAFNRESLVVFEQKLKTLYRQKGYLNLQVALELQQNRQLRDAETRVVVNMKEGPRSRFGEVFVKGLIKTHARIVKREMRWEPGDWFNPDLVEESRQALTDLGLFSSISMTPVETGGANPVVSYSILVREARPGTVSFGPGWSRAEGLRFTVESSYNNFDGYGRKIFSKGSLNEERDQTPLEGKTLLGRYAGIGYFEPWLFNKPVDGTLAFNYKAEARDNIWEISRSAEAILSHRIRKLRPKTLIEGFTLYKEAREEAEGAVKDASLIDSGNLQIREVGLRHVTDGRNNLAWPTRGYRVTSELSTADFVFGGSLKYIRWGLSSNIYREIVSDVVFAAGFSYTTYENVRRKDGADVLPSSERLESGGPETNRGFRENTLGPVFTTQDGRPIVDGGSRRSSQRMELRYQLVPETVAITGFLDSSNSSFSGTEEKRIREEHAQATIAEGGRAPQFSDNEPYALEDLISHPQYIWTKNYVSYGVAGNYLTPLGSVNLSFGWPWRRCLNYSDSCSNPRGNSNYRQLRGAVVSLNIGANF